jgi:hypothetical protein
MKMNMKHLNRSTNMVMALVGMVLLAGCGKPHDAASLPGEDSGGYAVVSRFQTPGYANDVVVVDDLAYLAEGEGGLLVVDVSDRQNPEIVSVTTENVRGYSVKIEVKDSVAYIAAGSFGVTVVHVGDPYNPFVTVSNTSMKPARSLHIMGDVLFTAVSEVGVSIADISYPTQPDPRGGIHTVGYAQDVVTTSDSAYALAACGEMGLSMYNIADFQNGFGEYPQAGWCDTPGYAVDIEIDDDKKLAYLACGTAGMQIIDYSDTTDIHIVGFVDQGGYIKELTRDGEMIYMTAELSGFQAVDVSDPTAPELVGQIDTEFALGITHAGNYIYIADETEGLIVIRKPQ